MLENFHATALLRVPRFLHRSRRRDRASIITAADRAYEELIRLERDAAAKRRAFERSTRAEMRASDRLLGLLREIVDTEPSVGGSNGEGLEDVWGTTPSMAPAPAISPLIAQEPNAPAEPTIADGPSEAELPAAADLAARLFGPFAFAQNGHKIETLHGAKPRAALQYLLAHRGRPVPRDVLVDLLWPNVDTSVGRRNLHQVIYALRRTLRQCDPTTQHIVYSDGAYGINPEIDVWTDVEWFDLMVTKGRRLEVSGEADAAVAAYADADRVFIGDFLADQPYEEWAIVERERLRVIRHEILDRLGDLLVAKSRFDEAISVSQRLLAHNHAAEQAHRRIIYCYWQKGCRSLAIQQYQSCVQALDRDHGLPPSAETEAIYHRLLR